MAYDWTQNIRSVVVAKCPRCRKNASVKGFRKNPDPYFDNEICWKCWRQSKYCIEQNRVIGNYVGISLQNARILVLKHYGAFCKCCGEEEKLFLEVDHINNDGAEHRKMIKGMDICVWLVNNNYPDDFQILCANCNHGKYRNAGICPHERIRLALVS